MSNVPEVPNIGTNSIEYNPNVATWKTIYETKIDNFISKSCITKKTISNKSNSSTDKSITNDSSDDDNEDKKLTCGKCLLKFKK